jgi:hypothetical protein
VSTNPQIFAQLGISAYSIYPLPIGYTFNRYADFDHGGHPERDGLELPAPTEQQWLELNRLAPLAEAAGFWVTLTQLGPNQPLRLTTTLKGYQAHENGLQWCDSEPFKAYHRAAHYLRSKAERHKAGAAAAAVEERLRMGTLKLAPAEYVGWVREHLEPWQAWAQLSQWEEASLYPDYCFALRLALEADPLLLAA